MVTFLMILFVLLCLFLALFVLIQQGKGDMGLGALGGGSQQLFGGSGGQSFFEKATWIMGAIFILGALGLAIFKTKQHGASQLQDVVLPQKASAPTQPGQISQEQTKQNQPEKNK